MRSPRLARIKQLGAATFATVAIVSPAAAVDHLVHVQCIPAEPYSSYGMDPDTVIVAAGVDRIVFESAPASDQLICLNEWMAPTFEFDLWLYPLQPVSLWFSGEASPPQGPFCEPGTRLYNLFLRGSHGDIRGSFGPFVVEVTSPPVRVEREALGRSIGVFADPHRRLPACCQPLEVRTVPTSAPCSTRAVRACPGAPNFE